MSVRLTTLVRSAPAAAATILVAAGGVATLLGAYFFQYVLLIAPCPLCLDQRKIWYAAVPLALVVAVSACIRRPRWLVLAGLSVLVLVLLFGAGFSAYHSGVEWKWWPGPQDCTGPIADFGKAGTLLQKMQTTSVVRCDEASWRFLGLSLAGYNALISLALAVVAACGLALEQRMRGSAGADQPVGE